MKITDSQQKIIALAKSNGGSVTKQQVVEYFGQNYYCGESNHLGAMLSRMVNAGLLVREKKGSFTIGSGKKPAPAVESGPSQPTLF